jgi:mRNA interferase MazF
MPFTTDQTDAPLFRLLIEPDPGNGLDSPGRIMVDKITTVRRSRLGRQIGVLDDANVVRLSRALVVFLGIAIRP